MVCRCSALSFCGVSWGILKFLGVSWRSLAFLGVPRLASSFLDELIQPDATMSNKRTQGPVMESVVPKSLAPTKTRACMSCSLIKTMQQFVEFGCENCPFMHYRGDREQVSACTTTSFTGTMVSLKPKHSWVAKWQRVSRFVPGAYAVSINARLPFDIVEHLEENNRRPHPVTATTSGALE